jgi:hypothetical protein
MKIRIMITTPKGQAKDTDKRIRPFLIGFNRVKVDTYINKEDNKMFWEVEGDIRPVMKVQNNVARFDVFLNMLLTNKMVSGQVKKMKKEDREELLKMLKEQTTCELIKEATAEEIVESNKTFIQKIKETFIQQGK